MVLVFTPESCTITDSVDTNTHASGLYEWMSTICTRYRCIHTCSMQKYLDECCNKSI